MTKTSLAACVAMCLFLSACNKTEAPKSSGSSAQSGSGAAKAAEPPPGRAVSKPDQLLGTWFRDDNGEVLGFEFGKDSKVVITPVGGGALTLDYAVMDGGRVRLTNSGMTSIFNCSIDGSKMTFQPEGAGSFFNCSKFVKLKSGQTLMQANQEKQQEIAKKQKEMSDAITKEIAKPNLSIVSADSKMRLDRFALDVKGTGGVLTGTAYVEFNPVIARQAQVSLAPARSPEQWPGVVVQMGQVTGPPGMHQMNAETLTFRAEMDGSKIRLTDGGRLLTSDSDTFGELTGKYKKDAEARQAMVDAFAAKFGAYTRFEGQYSYPQNPNAKPRPAAWAMLRVEGKPVLLIADLSRDSNPSPAAFGQQGAEVGIQDNKPYLALSPSLGGGTLQPDPSGDTLTLVGDVQGQRLVLKGVQTMTKEQLAKRRADVAEFLDKTLASGTPYALCGWYQTDDRPETPIYPAHMTLVNAGQRNITGDFGADWIGATCAHATKVTETLLGAKLAFDATKVTKFDGDNFRGGPVGTIDLLWTDSGPTFTGVCKASNGNVLTLFPATPDRAAADHKKLDAALARNVVFAARTDGYNSGMRPATITLTPGDGAGTLKGTAQFPVKRGGLSDVAGKITERDGFAVVELQFTAKDQSGKSGKVSLWTLTDPTIGGGSASPLITLTGYADWDGFKPKHPMSMSFREAAPAPAP
jgi:hypothetical protein